jgi:hypothetical protein
VAYYWSVGLPCASIYKVYRASTRRCGRRAIGLEIAFYSLLAIHPPASRANDI